MELGRTKRVILKFVGEALSASSILEPTSPVAWVSVRVVMKQVFEG